MFQNNNCKGFNVSSSYKCNYDTSKVEGYPKPGKSNVNPNDCWRNVSNQETKNKFCRFYKKYGTK